MSCLYVVATPIGNLKDITYRAVETLKAVAVIACEDTRHSLRLLNHYDIRKRLLSCRSHNQAASASGIVNLLRSGQAVAYLTDAGTPGLSDPGALLVRAVRQAGFAVIPLPGASAFATLVSAAGLDGRTVTFEGFLSPKPGKRRTRLRELLERGEAFVLYESPHRILKLMEGIADLEPQRNLLIGREMTKEFEEFVEGGARDVLAALVERQPRGEYSVLVWGAKKR